MSRYIDADKLIRKYIDTDIKKFSNSDVKIVLENLKQNILKAPSIDIEPKRGEWIWSPRDTDGTVSGCCSNCSFSHLFIGGHTAQYNYCPNCGARMKGADDGAD